MAFVLFLPSEAIFFRRQDPGKAFSRGPPANVRQPGSPDGNVHDEADRPGTVRPGRFLDPAYGKEMNRLVRTSTGQVVCESAFKGGPWLAKGSSSRFVVTLDRSRRRFWEFPLQHISVFRIMQPVCDTEAQLFQDSMRRVSVDQSLGSYP